MNEPWHTTYDHVSTLGLALLQAGFDARQLQNYYEKPWRWTKEWEALQRGQEALERLLNGEDDE